MKIEDKAPEAAAAEASSADYTVVVENGQPKRACKTLTPEQREQIVELTEERARDALPDYFEHKRKAPKKPAGEPPDITGEQRAAIFTYYKSGGEKPEFADRFSYDADKGQYIDLERKQWLDNGGRAYLNEQWALHDELGQIRDRITDEALEPFDLYNPDRSIPTENIPLYSEIVAAVAEVLSRVIDELEAAGLENIPAFYVPPGNDIWFFPVDKYNWAIWHGIPANVTADIKLKPARKGNAIKIGSFRASKALEEEHFYTCLAIYNFWQNGQYEFTARQLYRKTHNGTEPSADNLEKLQKLVTDLLETTIYFNDSGIAREKGFTMYREGTRQLLNGAVYNSRAFFNGELVESYISISKTDPPFLMHYAYTLGQYTYFPAEMLNPPSSKTNLILSVNHYIADKVAHGRRKARRSKSKQADIKFKWTTFFEDLGITDRRKKSRARQYARKYIDLCIECKQVTSFKESGPNYTDTVTLVCKYAEPAQIGPTNNAQISKN